MNTVIGRFLGFFLVPFYTNKFSPDDYGIITIIYSYIAILNVFFSAGLESGFMKFYSSPESGSKKQNFSNPLEIVLLNSFFLSILIYFFSDDLTTVFQVSGSYSYLIKYSALILFFDTIVLIPFAFLRINNKAFKFSGIKIVNITVNVILNVILISFFNFGIEAVFISNLIASIITLIMLFPVIKENFTFGFNKELIKELLKFSIPYIPAGISANLIQIIDRPVLKYLTDDKTVGIYTANYKLGIFMLLIVSMFEFAWRPFFLNNAREPDAKEIFSKVMTLFISAAGFIFLVISFFISDIVELKLPYNFNLIGKAYWSGLNIVPVILFSYLLYGIYINLMAGIQIEKKTKYLPLITGTAAFVNITSNFILIPEYSYMGAAVATLLSYFVMMAGIYYFAQKYYYIKYEFSKIGFAFVYIIGLSAIAIYLHYSGNLNFIFKIILISAYLLLIHFSKIINLKSLRNIFG
ncbi:MAG: hypothetical protein HGGPFJEG_02691 [Ignavibacteria bacterium]|nr:hypothetical protein [Ignavibacteria bacterium]